MKTVIVTGGNGFIGHHLCEFLLGDGCKVISVDNFYSSNREKVNSLKNNQNFKFIEHDIINPLKISQNIDEIYHLACPASPPKYQLDPIFTLQTCTVGTKNILDLSLAKNAKILLTSTSEVYGEPIKHPQKEDYRGNVNPVGPRACYDEGKRISETYFFEYGRNFGCEVKIARLFNTYGPGMDPYDGRVVSNLIVSAVLGKKFPIFGDGKQTRSFCYVSDLVAGLVSLMSSDANIKGPINLGNPSEMTIMELADKVSVLMGRNLEYEFHDLPQDDPTKRCPDITKGIKELNWRPFVSIDQGLAYTIEYFTNQLQKT